MYFQIQNFRITFIFLLYKDTMLSGTIAKIDSRFHPAPFRIVASKVHVFAVPCSIESIILLVSDQEIIEDSPGLRNTFLFFSQLFISDRITVNITPKANVGR